MLIPAREENTEQRSVANKEQGIGLQRGWKLHQRAVSHIMVIHVRIVQNIQVIREKPRNKYSISSGRLLVSTLNVVTV